jgi:phosphatidyl-myo-inositol dimannoside synthase
MSRPQLLVITPDFPPARGGIQILTHQIVAALPHFEPTVITLNHPEAQAFDEGLDFRVIRVRAVAGLRPATVLALNVRAVVNAMRHRPDVTLSTHIVAGPAAAFLRHRRSIPFVQYIHAKEVGARPGVARFALRRADRIIAVSRYTHGLAVAAGANADRIVLINPGVELPAPPHRAARDNGAPPTVLTISRLEDRYKGHDVVLRAMPLIQAAVPDVRWRIIGDGPLRPTLEDRARTMGLGDCVQFLGAVSDEVRDEELARANAFCMVSRLPTGGFAGEGFGIVYLEANARGVPVVAGNVGGATDAVVDGETGLLVDPEDHLDVADAITRLLVDRDLARRLGRRGRERAQGFAWPLVAAAVESILLELIR